MAKSGDIKGMNKLLKDLANLGSKGTEAIADVTEANARDIQLMAVSLAPVNKNPKITGGSLKQSSLVTEINKLAWNIAFTARYAPYMEYGTGGLVDIPEELKDNAIQFKGKGIKKININPQPFLYPAFVKGRVQYIKDLEEELKQLTKKI